MTWKVEILILFLATLTFSSALLYQSEIDEKLSSAHAGRVYKESRIKKTLDNFSTKIKSCSAGVKNVRDVANSLESYNNVVQRLMTIGSFKSYEGISTCGDINYKIIMQEFEKRKLDYVMTQIRTNTTCLYKQQSELQSAYYSNLNALGYMSTSERCVWSIIQELNQVLNSYWDYLRTLTMDIASLTYFNSLLTIFKKNYCQCLATTSYTGLSSTLLENVQVRFLIQLNLKNLKIFF